MSSKECLARYEAFAEAAGHLELSWTEDEVEWQQGLKVQAFLRKEADKYLGMSIERGRASK